MTKRKSYKIGDKRQCKKHFTLKQRREIRTFASDYKPAGIEGRKKTYTIQRPKLVKGWPVKERRNEKNR